MKKEQKKIYCKKCDEEIYDPCNEIPEDLKDDMKCASCLL